MEHSLCIELPPQALELIYGSQLFSLLEFDESNNNLLLIPIYRHILMRMVNYMQFSDCGHLGEFVLVLYQHFSCSFHLPFYLNFFYCSVKEHRKISVCCSSG